MATLGPVGHWEWCVHLLNGDLVGSLSSKAPGWQVQFNSAMWAKGQPWLRSLELLERACLRGLRLDVKSSERGSYSFLAAS